MMLNRPRSSAFVFVLVALAACGDSTSPPEPAELVGLSGDDQTATVGETLADPIRVRVLDTNARPVRDVEVVFEVTTGSGSLSAGAAEDAIITVSTDRDGTAEAFWTLGPLAGQQTGSASVEGLPPVEFSATAEPVPDVSGFWSGQYSVTGCTLSGASDPFFCTDVFFIGASLIFEMDLDQVGPDVFGVVAQGGLTGDVEGTVDKNGELRLDGVIGGVGEAVTTTILGWQTDLVGDSLLGSWRFLVEDNTGSGFGSATVDANLRLYGPSVLKFWGCAVEGTLSVDGSVGGSLATGDCQLDDASYFDVFVLTGSAGDSLEVALRSTSFDAFLLISDVEEQVLGSDDDSGGGPGGTDAALTVVFDVGATVLVIANSFEAGETGSYVLSATRLGPTPVADAAATEVRVGPVYRVMQGGSMKQEAAGPAYRSPVGWKFSGLASRKVKR